MPSLRSVLYLSGFAVAVAVAVAIVAYNMYGALTLTPIPPGRMSIFTYIGLKDLQRGTLSGEALKAPALFAYVLGSLGLGEFTATKGAALLSLAALPFVGGLFGYLVRGKLVGAASALLLALIPFTYLSAIGGDYTFVSALVLVQFTLLFSLLLLGDGRRWLAPVWLALSSTAAALAGLDIASASWLLLVTSLLWAAYGVSARRRVRSLLVVIPGIVGAAFSALATPQDPTEALRAISPIATLPQYQLLLWILGMAGLAGAVSLGYRIRRDAIPALSFVAAGLGLVAFYGAEAFLLVFPGVVVLAMVPLLETKGMLAAVRETGTSGEEQVAVEVHFEKFAAFAFAMIVLSSPLVTGLGPGSAVQGTNYLGNEELQTIGQVRTLNSSLFGQGLVAAPSSIGPWLRAELGVNTILALTPFDAGVADAMTSTTFRLRSSYLMADEWTPLSTVRSPFIYAFDGAVYGAILHLDDGTNSVNLTSAQGGKSEDMSGMYLLGHSFSQNGTAMTLTMKFTKSGFNATKQISMATGSPDLLISYDVVPNHGTPTSMTLPVYIEGVQKIADHVNGDAIALSMAGANLTMTFPGGSTPELLHGQFQDYVRSTFNATKGEVRASVLIEVQSAKSSGLGPLYSSLLDQAREFGISSLLTFPPQPGLSFVGAARGPSMALDTKDAFNRVLLTLNGTKYVESPSGARVLSQSVSNSSCDASVDYQTAGLNIQKTISSSNDSVSLSYSVRPTKNGVTLDSMNMTFWIPPARTLLNYESSPRSLYLRLDSGTVTITPAAGSNASIDFGPDPVYGQLRALLTFTLNGGSGKVSATMNLGKQVSCREILASRPVMNGTDELQLFVLTGAFVQAFSNQFFTIYQVFPGELPP